jgi:carboxymethylenebutenolidase
MATPTGAPGPTPAGAPGPTPAGAPAPTRVLVPTTDGDVPAYRWLPPLGTGPGIVVLQEIFGVSEYIRSRCADLAALGYVVLAPELYWRLAAEGADTQVDESAPDFLQQAMGLVGRLDWEAAVGDGAAALTHLRSLPEVSGGAGLLGFCFGGGLAFNVAAISTPDVLVSYYGSALPTLLDLADRVTAPSLHHFGSEDAFVEAAAVARIRDVVTGPGSNAANRFELHDGAGHAFDNPHPVFHHAGAAQRAWATTTAFLAEHLPVPAP